MEAERDQPVKNQAIVVLTGMTWETPPGIDPECIKICTALNELPGIRTVESCCGHGEQPFWIWLMVTDPTALGLLTLSRCLCHRYGRINLPSRKGWKAILDHFDMCPQLCFRLEGPVGDYAGADAVAENILDYTRDRMGEYYNILTGMAGGKKARYG